jgi:hypothetical protein
MRSLSTLAHGACLLWLASAAAPCRAGGEVYSHIDRVSGMVVLNNVPPPARSAAAPAPGRAIGAKAQATSADFPSVSPVRQRELDVDRRAILQDELNEEQRSLAAASGARAARDVLARHAANIAALQRELARLAGTGIN